MSSGGTSNYSSGATGGGTGVTPEPSAPYAQSAPAPSGGKGGYNPNPYSQQQPQQPQVYMPPSQPTFYDQAFMQPQVRSYGLGGMGGGNAYARPFRSYGSPVEAPPPPDEMRFVPAVMPDTYPTRAPPVNYSDMRIDSFGPPVEATRAVMPEPNYSGGLGSLFGGMSGSVSYSLKPPPSGFGPLQQQNPQLLAQMQEAEFENQRKAADLQRLRSQPYDPRQLIG